jgi:hypothetical protein
MTRDELIAALEAATGPDRALDQAIWAVIAGWSYPLVGAAVYDFAQNGANYTESVEAAITLVPEGEGWEIDFGPNSTSAKPDVIWWCASVGIEDATASTPAIAVCIAALKAGAVTCNT